MSAQIKNSPEGLVFTKQQLKVLLSSLYSWNGPHRYTLETLSSEDKLRLTRDHAKALICKSMLLDKFNELYKEISNGETS